MLCKISSRLGVLSSSNIAENNQWPLQDVSAMRAFINDTQTEGYRWEPVLSCGTQMMSCCLVTDRVECGELMKMKCRKERKRRNERKQSRKHEKENLEMCIHFLSFLLMYQNKFELQEFLGLASYYSRFVPTIAQFLHHLTEKSVSLAWNEGCLCALNGV